MKLIFVCTSTVWASRAKNTLVMFIVNRHRACLPLIGAELIIAYWHASRDAPAKSACLDWIQKRVQKRFWNCVRTADGSVAASARLALGDLLAPLSWVGTAGV
jgi:hypothetical protein